MTRYTLLARLGEGSMGTVWHATRRLSDGRDQDVAIKFVHEQWRDDRDALERFQREARLCMRLHHTNIVDVYDLDSIDDKPCIVMELIDGITLEQLTGCRSLPYAAIRVIVHDVLAGLKHAHSSGVLHRDLSPGNIMIGRNGIVRLTDLGLAKNLRGKPTIGMLMGTLPYLAPEVLQLQEWSPGTDIYSLGAVLYTICAGAQPYDADSRRGMLNEMRARSIEPLPRSVPSDLRHFIVCAFNLSPDRYAEAMAAARELTPATEEARAQLAAMVGGILDEGEPGADLETAATIPLQGTRERRVARDKDADVIAAQDDAAGIAAAPPPRTRKRRLRSALAAALAVAALLAAMAIGYQLNASDQPSATIAPLTQPESDPPESDPPESDPNDRRAFDSPTPVLSSAPASHPTQRGFESAGSAEMAAQPEHNRAQLATREAKRKPTSRKANRKPKPKSSEEPEHVQVGTRRPMP